MSVLSAFVGFLFHLGKILAVSLNDGGRKESFKLSEFMPGAYKVLYVYQINDGRHDGRLKVGDATYHTSKTLEEIQEEANENSPFRNSGFPWSTSEIVDAARKRIDEQTKTADVEYKLLWAVLAVKPDLEVPGRYLSFRDYEIHSVLMRSGVVKSFTRNDKKSGEWFEAPIETVKKAFQALIEGRDSIDNSNPTALQITLRDEQKAAVKETLKVFRKGTVDNPKDFLWNAIMRFGKTLTTYALVKELDDVSKVLIMTHRPVVLSGWYEDFGKSFDSASGWKFGSKKEYGESWDKVKNIEKFFYFASIQDLRGSFIDEFEENGLGDEELSAALYSKNSELFGTEFDLIVLDESHEGTQTGLAELVNSNLRAKYRLHLSGTPFNIIDGFEGGEVYSWSYTDEQKASEDWQRRHEAWLEDSSNAYPGDVNPYGKLPRMEIRNLWINDIFKNHSAVDPTTTRFNFAKFFEVDRSKLTAGKVYDDFHQFTNVAAIDQLLNHMTANDEHGSLEVETGSAQVDHKNWPFSRDNSKRDFAHTFWVVPTVEAAVALHERLNVHPGFSDFAVVNATGDNDGGDALAAVKKAIKENDRTITLSVGKLTTGTTVPEWTAVFMLSNMRSPMLYMQTIFRVKSSGSLADGRQKEVGYVFDFAPDRSLEMISQSVAKTASRVDGYADLTLAEKDNVERAEMEEMLKYLPVISYEGNRFVTANTDKLMRTLHKVYIGRAVDSGFYDPKLFKFDFHGITDEQMEFANKMVGLIGKSSKDSAIKKMTIATSRLSEADKKILDKDRPKRGAPQPEKDAWDEAAQKLSDDRKNGKKIVQLLRGVSARIPMLVFATDVNQTVTLDNLPEIIDDESWKEFMPKGFDKEAWDNLKGFFNRPVFEGACDEIRNRVRKIYTLPMIPRIAGIAHIFSIFRNPDKETILTPWSVVNLQVADTLGGLRFVDNDGKWFTKNNLDSESDPSHTWSEIEDSDGELELDPQWTEVDEDLKKFWDDNYTTALDINSKTALYPLYMAASLWYRIREEYRSEVGTIDLKTDEEIWKEVVENQIFVNCRVPYSKSIAQRVLAGHNDWTVKASVIDVLDIRRKLNDSKIKKEDQKAVWKWLFNPKNLHTATERANEVLTSENLEEIVALAKASNEDKFSVITSNPPYQMENDSNGATAVYHHFMNVSQMISRSISMIYPLRWTNGGQGEGLNEFKEKETISKHYSKYFATMNSENIFENVEIKGGLNYFLWTLNENPSTSVYIDGMHEERVSLSNGLDIVILSILGSKLLSSKILVKNSFADNVMPRYWYGSTLMNESSLRKIQSDDSVVECFYAPKGSGVISSIRVKRDSLSERTLDDYKVFTLKTAPPLGWPEDNSRRGRIFVGQPNQCVTASFLKVGSFTTEKEAINCIRYMKTDFFVFLQTIVSVTHNAPRRNYKYIPNVNFATGEILDKPGTFLDFSKPETLDDQLAKIYNLTEDERNLMTKDLKPWKDKTSVTADM